MAKQNRGRRESRTTSSSQGPRRTERKSTGEKRSVRKFDKRRDGESASKRSFGENPARPASKDFKAPGGKRFTKRTDQTTGDKKSSYRKSSSDSRDTRSPRKERSDAFDKPKRPYGYSRREDSSQSDFKKGSFKKNKPSPSKAYYEGSKPPGKDSELTRLNKYISNAGICSRREADELIKQGLISVNGTVITEMGFKVKPGDEVRFEEKKLSPEKPVYILLNKPKGFITTREDDRDRKTVMELIANACKERVYPVGRLDRNTTGLLLLTNDGELAETLTHPSYQIRKVYKVELNKPLNKADFQEIANGVRLEEGRAFVDDVAYVDDSKKVIGIELHIGWNRIVRRIFETLGYEVIKLDRVAYAGLDKKDLPRGNWRFLTKEEVIRLKHFGKKK